MSVIRKPWEKRLEDLAHILRGCGVSYFDPDRFRRNTNQFLQTARTVTFIVQKNKADIPDFANWYQKHVIEAWAHDEVMVWAKDARNMIEKEGDLELNSMLGVSLIFSYLEEEDVEVSCGRNELLNAGVKKLIRLARKQLPTGIADAAGIRIERSWKTSSLRSYELLQGLSYVYSRLFECIESLAKHLGHRLPKSIPRATDLDGLGNIARQVQFIKLRDLQTYHMKSERMNRVSEDQLPPEFREDIAALAKSLCRPIDFPSAVKFFSAMAESTFNKWGNHVEMLFFLNADWSIQYMSGPALADQIDKFFFWRLVAEQIRVQKPHCVVHVAEAWLREMNKYGPAKAIRQLPIKGEHLQLSVVARDRNITVRKWPIYRREGDPSPTLGELEEEDEPEKRIFYLVPAMRSMGWDQLS